MAAVHEKRAVDQRAAMAAIEAARQSSASKIRSVKFESDKKKRDAKEEERAVIQKLVDGH